MRRTEAEFLNQEPWKIDFCFNRILQLAKNCCSVGEMEKEGCKSEAMGWASSESSTKPGGNKRLVKCECGVISPVRVASTKRNSGRRFRGCGRFGDG